MRSSPYYVFLQEIASRLATRYGQVAVPIGRIAYDHGIHIERSKTLARFKAHMVVPESKDDWVRVILPELGQNSSFDGPSNYDRFCVAHELAHLLLYREFDAKPIDQASYWKHEYLCDEFARTLLVPDSFIHELSEKEMDIHTLRRVADVVKVPMMHVARRVTQFAPHTTFLHIQKKTPGDWKVVASSLDFAKETGKRIRSTFAIGIELFFHSSNLTRSWNIDGATLSRSNFESFDEQKKYSICAVKHITEKYNILIAVVESGSIEEEEPSFMNSIEMDLSSAIQRSFDF